MIGVVHHTHTQPLACKYILSSLCVGFPTSDVDESVPRDGAVFAVEVEVEQSTLPITVVKLIADVPAQRTKLLPLLRQNKDIR